jgi:hypothetical protein
MKKQRNDGEEQKQVNQTCTYMENQETACPQQQENKEDDYEHGRPPEAEMPSTNYYWMAGEGAILRQACSFK